MRYLSIKMAPSMPRKQRGVSLIESLISLLLIAIMGAGLAMVSSRSLVTQRYVTTQNLAVMQMREHMKTAEPDDALYVYFGKEGGEDFVSPNNNPNSSDSQATVTVSIGLNGSSHEIADIPSPVVNRSVSLEAGNSWLGGTISIGQTQ